MRLDLLKSLGGFDETCKLPATILMLRASNQSQPEFIPFPIAHFQQGGASTQNWRTAIAEFHRARTSVFEPRGIKRLQEWTDTAVGFAKTSLAPVKAGLYVNR